MAIPGARAALPAAAHLPPTTHRTRQADAGRLPRPLLLTAAPWRAAVHTGTWTCLVGLLLTVACTALFGLGHSWYCERMAAQLSVWCVVLCLVVLPLVVAGGLHRRARGAVTRHGRTHHITHSTQ